MRAPERVTSQPESDARYSVSRTRAAVRASPGKDCADERGCSACTASRKIKARNSICGHSGKVAQRSIRPSSASPQDSASTTATPAAQDAGRQ